MTAVEYLLCLVIGAMTVPLLTFPLMAAVQKLEVQHGCYRSRPNISQRIEVPRALVIRRKK